MYDVHLYIQVSNTFGFSVLYFPHLKLCSNFTHLYRTYFNKHMKRDGIADKNNNQPQVSGISLCNVCGKTFKSKFGLSLHIKNKHEKTFRHVCTMCNKGFNQKVQQRYHCSSHLKVPLDKCKFFKIIFFSHGSLKRHLETCRDVKPDIFVCDNCQATFPQKEKVTGSCERETPTTKIYV